jgi:CRP/FNR family cyclic AMP-dependent transcriptional regulator
MARLSLTEAIPLVVEALTAPAPLIRETAIWTLVKLGPTDYWQHVEALINDPSPQVARLVKHLQAVRNGAKVTMLSTLEKVFILKIVDIFAETPEEALAEVSSILEEMEVKKGETVFEKGDPGHSLYIIFEGYVRVHDGQQTLSELGGQDIFGEMALLEAETRSASVTALEDTHLLRLDQAPFYELMADQNEVTWGIIRVLVRRLRVLSQKLTDAQKPNQDREKPGQPKSALLDGIMSKLQGD